MHSCGSSILHLRIASFQRTSSLRLSFFKAYELTLSNQQLRNAHFTLSGWNEKVFKREIYLFKTEYIMFIWKTKYERESNETLLS